MNACIDLRATAIIGRDDQRAFRRMRIFLRDGHNPFRVAFHFVDAALLLQTLDRLSAFATGQLLDGPFQLRIALRYDLIELDGLHVRVLQPREDAAGFARFMLTRISDQKHPVVRM